MNLNAHDKNIDIVAIQNGDRKVFTMVIDLYYNEIYIFARSLCRDEAVAKDLVQEVFFGLWKKRRKLNKKTVIRGWLYQSVRNKFIDHIRKYSKETYFFEKTFSDTMDNLLQPEYQDELNRKLELLEKEIELLPKKCHEVFILSKKEGLTNNEIAEYLGISVKTVEGHLTNALKILREKLYEKIQLLFVFVNDLRKK